MLWLERAHGGSTGTPDRLVPTTAIRFKTIDDDGIDDTGPLFVPDNTVRLCEQWLRVMSDGDEIRNLRLLRAGPLPRGVTDYWGQAATYEVPVSEIRVAQAMLTEWVLLARGPLTGPGQLGPWLVLQWEVRPGVVIGKQPDVSYRLTYDRY